MAWREDDGASSAMEAPHLPAAEPISEPLRLGANGEHFTDRLHLHVPTPILEGSHASTQLLPLQC